MVFSIQVSQGGTVTSLTNTIALRNCADRDELESELEKCGLYAPRGSDCVEWFAPFGVPCVVIRTQHDETITLRPLVVS